MIVAGQTKYPVYIPALIIYPKRFEKSSHSVYKLVQFTPVGKYIEYGNHKTKN